MRPTRKKRPTRLADPQREPVLTLKEAADWLRVSEQDVRDMVARQGLQGREINGQWRFLTSAITQWLNGRNRADDLINQSGILAEDPFFDQMLEQIYKNRGRSEVDDN